MPPPLTVTTSCLFARLAPALGLGCPISVPHLGTPQAEVRRTVVDRNLHQPEATHNLILVVPVRPTTKDAVQYDVSAGSTNSHTFPAMSEQPYVLFPRGN